MMWFAEIKEIMGSGIVPVFVLVMDFEEINRAIPVENALQRAVLKLTFALTATGLDLQEENLTGSLVKERLDDSLTRVLVILLLATLGETCKELPVVRATELLVTSCGREILPAVAADLVIHLLRQVCGCWLSHVN